MIFNLQRHLARLTERLHPNSPTFDRVELHENIRALIELYETGQRKDDLTEIFIMKGKVVTFEEAMKSPHWVITEVRCCFFLSRFR